MDHALVASGTNGLTGIARSVPQHPRSGDRDWCNRLALRQEIPRSRCTYRECVVGFVDVRRDRRRLPGRNRPARSEKAVIGHVGAWPAVRKACDSSSFAEGGTRLRRRPRIGAAAATDLSGGCCSAASRTVLRNGNDPRQRPLRIGEPLVGRPPNPISGSPRPRTRLLEQLDLLRPHLGPLAGSRPTSPFAGVSAFAES